MHTNPSQPRRTVFGGAALGGTALALLLAVAGGAAVTVQGRMNALLTVASGEALAAAWISFATGLVVLTILLLTWSSVRTGLRAIPAAVRSGKLRWWELVGGVFGASLVASQSWAVPLIGIALFTVAIVGGQTLSALVVDKYGLSPRGHQPTTPGRVGAAALAALGVGVAAWAGRSADAGFEFLPIVVCALVGMGSSIQQAINAQVNVATGQVWSTTTVNFSLGTLLLSLLVGGLWVTGRISPHWPSNAPWWAWLSGLGGLFFIASSAWAVKHLGVLIFGVVMVTSQLAVAVAIDYLVPETRHLVTPATMFGLGLTAAGGILASLAGVRRRDKAPREPG